jgi:FkbM family methyltransferase
MLFLVLLIVLMVGGSLSSMMHKSHNNSRINRESFYLSNATIAGVDHPCKHTKLYETTGNVKFPMCMGVTDQDMKNGMSIINLVNSRGYLPTCRIMQLMLWMSATVNGGKQAKETFVDIGSNIGSCSVHMASLGFPVILAEPVKEHIETIRGSAAINPYFHMDIHHVGIASEARQIRANFGHGARNWGATEFHEVTNNDEKAELEVLKLRTVDQLIGSRKVALMKVDCEGCEWAALKSAKRALKRIPMIKIELVQPVYEEKNETVHIVQILEFLEKHDYELFVDHWNEQHLYFGKQPNDILDLDRMFGSIKFNLQTDMGVLYASAKRILEAPLDVTTYNREKFLKSATDVIAINRQLAWKMKQAFLSPEQLASVAFPSG